ncbi:MAG: LacI family DNA-binding transcriptional regulator [Streptomyces turgidiscabies]|nr:LacI family DNA-binding transcriptional regulator [Streptomyces turgidiscabies]
MGRQVTLEDVAAEAQVSKSSVSNVINNHPHVRESMRQRVNEAIEKLGYRPQAIGQHLVSGRTGLVSLAIPNFAQPYFAELARAAVAAADDVGMRLIVQQTDNLLEREREAADSWNLGAADGLIFSPSVIEDQEIEARRGRAPLVLLGERSKLSSVDRVGIDSVAIAHAATQHLLDQGRTRLLMIGEKTFGDPFVVSEREAGFHQALDEAGLREAGPVGGVRDWTRDDGARVIDEILEAGIEFDGIFCANDLLALGAMSALRRHGLRVPDDVAVIGIDDIEDGRFASPTLSTMFIDKEWMAREAVRLLAKQVDDADSIPEQLSVPFHLIARESTTLSH